MPPTKKKTTKKARRPAAEKSPKPSARRKPMKAARATSHATVTVRQFKKIAPCIAGLASSFAQCEHEIPHIEKLLYQLYCTGFTSGAIESRKMFTDWKPSPKESITPDRSLMDFAQEFYMSLHAIHQAPVNPKDAN